MIIHTVRIPYKFGETIKVDIYADIHYGNTACDVDGLKRDLEEDPDSYGLGLGDWFDAVVVPDPRYRKSIDASVGDDIIDEQIYGLEDIIFSRKPADKWLGCGIGNHEDTITRHCGTNIMKRFCQRNGVQLLGYSGLLRLALSDGGNRGRSIVIRYHHGWGGGSRTLGADLTKYSRDVAYWKADAFVYGHVHRRQADKIPRMGLSGKELVDMDMPIAICGTYLKTYTEGYDSTYSERAGYPPTTIGKVTLNIKPKRYWVKMWIDT